MTHDPVHAPAHYMGDGLEAIDVIEDWGLGFHLGNAFKYVVRADVKGARAQDLEKARWYLRRAGERIAPLVAISMKPRQTITSGRVAAAFDLTTPLALAVYEISCAAAARRAGEARPHLARAAHYVARELGLNTEAAG